MNTKYLVLILFFGLSCTQSENYVTWQPVEEVITLDSLSAGKNTITLLTEAGKTGVYGCQVGSPDNTMLLEFTEENPGLCFTPKAIGLPESWKDFSAMDIKLNTPDDAPFELKITYIGHKNKIEKLYSPGSNANIEFDLNEIPLAGRPETMFEPQLILFEFHSVQPGMKVRIEEIALRKIPRQDQGAVVDPFGQRVSTDWQGKVSSENDLLSNLEQELTVLDQESDPGKNQDQYGGIKTGKSYPSGGFFSLYKNGDGNYFFITPEGNPFWSLGVTCVRPRLKGTDGTTVEGREYLFEYIPERNGKYSEVWSDSTEMSYYYLNILKKYGSLESWIDMIYKRFDSWGINTIGNWSNEKVLEKSKTPFTYSFRTTLNPLYSLGSGLNDVFDPGWEAYVDSVFSDAAKYKDNPYLLGYFVDNEAGWGNTRLLEKLSQTSPGREAWLDLLKQRYTSLEKLNQTWIKSFSSWNEVKMMNKNLENENFWKDYTRFESLFAQKYFQTVRKSLKKHDPNHLYLGCRFTRRLKPDHILEQAGNYCDVITVNVYSLVPEKEQMTAWYEKTGKPILIGEHHLPLITKKQFPPLYPAFTSEERNQFYIEYVKTWAKLPFSLGCHWYQLVDQHITGRPSNGENQVIGLVDITDQPYEHMVEAIHTASDSIYNWHLIK
ncbi:MAG: beta-galactosidase [Bacteroidales bacterium]